LSVGNQSIELQREAVAATVRTAGEEASLSLRPESIGIQRAEGGNGTADSARSLRGKVNMHQFLGAYIRYWVEVEGQELIVDDHNPRQRGILSGDVDLRLGQSEAQLFPAEE